MADCPYIQYLGGFWEMRYVCRITGEALTDTDIKLKAMCKCGTYYSDYEKCAIYQEHRKRGDK